MVKVKSDGNGGYDINVQKSILMKWGPAGLAIFMVLTSMGSSMGGEVWDWVTGHEAVERQVQNNAADIKELRSEVRMSFRELRRGQTRLTEILLNDTSVKDEGDDK